MSTSWAAWAAGATASAMVVRAAAAAACVHSTIAPRRLVSGCFPSRNRGCRLQARRKEAHPRAPLGHGNEERAGRATSCCGLISRGSTLRARSACESGKNLRVAQRRRPHAAAQLSPADAGRPRTTAACAAAPGRCTAAALLLAHHFEDEALISSRARARPLAAPARRCLHWRTFSACFCCACTTTALRDTGARRAGRAAFCWREATRLLVERAAREAICATWKVTLDEVVRPWSGRRKHCGLPDAWPAGLRRFEENAVSDYSRAGIPYNLPM